jgi:hypothetical protein
MLGWPWRKMMCVVHYSVARIECLWSKSRELSLEAPRQHNAIVEAC